MKRRRSDKGEIMKKTHVEKGEDRKEVLRGERIKKPSIKTLEEKKVF